jgi:hypothetical protein
MFIADGPPIQELMWIIITWNLLWTIAWITRKPQVLVTLWRWFLITAIIKVELGHLIISERRIWETASWYLRSLPYIVEEGIISSRIIINPTAFNRLAVALAQIVWETRFRSYVATHFTLLIKRTPRVSALSNSKNCLSAGLISLCY